MSPRWPVSEVEKFDEMTAQNRSIDEIAIELGRPRNAIIGMRRRRGAALKRKAVHMAEDRKQRPVVAKPPPKKPIDMRWDAPILPIEPRELKWKELPGPGVSFEDHRFDQCRWPNDGSQRDGTYRVCGAAFADLIDGKSTDELPYCPHHCRMAYVPPQGCRRREYACRSKEKAA